jgi:hypothetical protein
MLDKFTIYVDMRYVPWSPDNPAATDLQTTRRVESARTKPDTTTTRPLLPPLLAIVQQLRTHSDNPMRRLTQSKDNGDRIKHGFRHDDFA